MSTTRYLSFMILPYFPDFFGKFMNSDRPTQISSSVQQQSACWKLVCLGTFPSDPADKNSAQCKFWWIFVWFFISFIINIIINIFWQKYEMFLWLNLSLRIQPKPDRNSQKRTLWTAATTKKCKIAKNCASAKCHKSCHSAVIGGTYSRK